MVVRKMKDKCKDAARMRREKERAEFAELSRLLPLPSSTTSQLDKASIIRLTSSYLRMRSAFPEGLGENWGRQHKGRDLRRQQHQTSGAGYTQPAACHQIKELGSLILQTLDGFVFAMHKDGKIMYISETASVHLGLPQIDLTGSSVFEYVHPSDREDIKRLLSLSESELAELNSAHDHVEALFGSRHDDTTNSTTHLVDEAGAGQLDHSSCNNGSTATTTTTTTSREFGRSFCMRMKCILPKRNAGLVSSGYKAIHCNGYLKARCKLTSTGNQPASGTQRQWESYALVAVGHSLLPTATTEVKLTNNSFMFRASLDLKFFYVESNMTEMLGLEQSDLLGQSLYQFVHVNDVQHLEQSHRLLLDKGQVVSRYYRLMKRAGGFLWVQSYATLVNNPRNMPRPQHIVVICMILADEAHDQSRFLYDRCQATATTQKPSDEAIPSYESPDSSYLSHHANRSVRPTIGATNPLATVLATKRDKALGGGAGQRRLKQRPASARSQSTNGRPIKPRNNIQNCGPAFIGDRQQLQQSFQATFENYLACPPAEQLSPSNSLSVDCSARSGLSFDSQTASGDFCSPGRLACPGTIFSSIGSTRRASDDSCSIVSSVASASISSGSSAQLSSEPDAYNQAAGGYPLGGDPGQNVHHHQFHTNPEANSILHVTESGRLDSCPPDVRQHPKLASSHAHNQADIQQQLDHPNHLVWMRADELSASLDEMGRCHSHYRDDVQFGVQSNGQCGQINSTNQPWSAPVHCASGSFGLPDTPPNSDIQASDYHHEHQQQIHHHQIPSETPYLETQQSYNSYANHSPTTVHFHTIPHSTQLYTV